MTAKTKKKQTPLMEQYYRIKGKYPDALLLFRVGDFYETFESDAITASNVLGIVLTKRANGSASSVELAGFPHHAIDTYLPKLVRAGFRVAICEQLEAPNKEKKIVKRGVTELVTPGVALNDQILENKQNNFLAAIHIEKDFAGISFIDISTGEFSVAEGSINYINQLIESFQPSEIILSKSKKKQFNDHFGKSHYTYALDEWAFTSDFAEEKLLAQFKTKSLKGFGLEELEFANIAAGVALYYLGETEHQHLKHINKISRLASDQFVWLDKFTISNLELVNSLHVNGKSLLDVMDKTCSPMGARLMKKWILFPLKKPSTIEQRLQVVELFIKVPELAELFEKQIRVIGDLERLTSKIAMQRVLPRDLQQVVRALVAIEPIKEACNQSSSAALKKIGKTLKPIQTLQQLIHSSILNEPSVHISKGNVIANGLNKELDKLRDISKNGKDLLLELQKREQEKTGISSLKIGFNNVFGYYLSVTNSHKDKVPDDWMRKQTLVNAERYITPELKELEESITGAETKILALEIELYEQLIKQLQPYIDSLLSNARLVAQIDCLLSFSILAQKNQYRKPIINESLELKIKDGRHPVIEEELGTGIPYVPNDIDLNNTEHQIMMITGPNMSGKSALLRQTALIVLMAQMGSFVPAHSAEIGWVDKIFTRVGASDNISSGESTFMVEMNETASIVNNISERSLILLDEIGRGTSTYDGISIAWSIAEYLHDGNEAKPKTLFATHYHELNELAEKFPRIHNYNIATKEVGQKVIFLRKLIPGGSNHSFGIHVAQMAGMPKDIVKRAKTLLKELEKKSVQGEIKSTLNKQERTDYQMNIFQMDHPEMDKVRESLENIDVNSLTPVEALLKLQELQNIIKGKK